jgi:hypothetical protein
MITMTPARDIKPGDIFSTDASIVRSVHLDPNGRVYVTAEIPGRCDKAATFPEWFPLPIWTEDAS